MDSPPPIRKKSKQVNSYIKYSGLGFQLLVTIAIAGWLGYLLDRYLSLKLPVFMLICILVGFAGSVYSIYRSINKE